jgi:hypothetical protein
MAPVAESGNPILRLYTSLLLLSLDVLSNSLSLLSTVVKVWIILVLGRNLPDREEDELSIVVDHKGDTNDYCH